MERILIPEELKGKELYDFLIKNKSGLIKQKKALKTKSASIISTCERVVVNEKGQLVETKSITTKAPIITNENELLVKVVANACWFCDADMDVLIDNSSKKTIQQRKGMIPHLHDHIHQIDAQIGDVQDIYLEDVPLRKLGVAKSGSTQCIIFETLLKSDYNPKVFDFYKKGKVNQHSIGLNYIQIELAINYEDSEKEYDFWKKYHDKIINKEVVDEAGYFWVVSEIKLLENSAVLFGSNELTPTLNQSVQSAKTAGDKASSTDPKKKKKFNLDEAIANVKFFKN